MKIIVNPDISFIVNPSTDWRLTGGVRQSQHIRVSPSFILQNSADFLQAVGSCAQEGGGRRAHSYSGLGLAEWPDKSVSAESFLQFSSQLSSINCTVS